MQLTQALTLARQIAEAHDAAVEADTGASLHLVVTGVGSVVITAKGAADGQSCRLVIRRTLLSQMLCGTTDADMVRESDLRVYRLAMDLLDRLPVVVVDDRVGTLLRRAS